MSKEIDIIIAPCDFDKDLFLFFDDNNVNRVSISDVIRSTQ